MTNKEWEQMLDEDSHREIIEPIWAYTFTAAVVCVLCALSVVAGIYCLWKVLTT